MRHFTVVGVCELQPVVPLALAVAFVRVDIMRTIFEVVPDFYIVL